MENILKEKCEKLMAIPGEVRGVVFKTDEEFILKNKGKEGIEMIEKELNDLGFPIKYNSITNMRFYPIGLRVASLLVIQKCFGFSLLEIRNMGKSAPKVSFVIKFFMQYFSSLQKTLKEVSKIWKKHYTIGNLQPIQIDETKKIIVLKLEEVKLDPLFCEYISGYFEKMMELIVKSKVFCQETKCSFKGEDFHEYTFTWN